MRTLIVDDEPAAIRRLVRLCEKMPSIEVAATANDGGKALAMLNRLCVDLILLDIEMPGLSGLAMAERLVGRMPAPAIVFVTAYEQFALQAFAVDAVGYLLKPVDPAQLRATIERIERRLAPTLREPTSMASARPVAAAIFWVPFRGTLLRLEGKDIDRITSEDDYARLHCGDKSYLVAERLYAIEQRLGGDCFVRVHRSTLVNSDRVEALENDAGTWSVRLSSGERLAIGRSFLPAVRSRLGITI
ncbi:LytR/AlgR family response regulator transcription factor [Sphingomonas japonica]|uniref:Two-component system response regulator AlgR n=1 Tax=Sphingomonas japonica TaxID=511662 RepID=A0ABX0U5U0_9SPHN|nr:LytTR family DNA-binding domain-containing protein [Sphingomonas japonica]NIJ25234.1 two-component system response regulator AlgR [Sphingomonas japonica]